MGKHKVRKHLGSELTNVSQEASKNEETRSKESSGNGLFVESAKNSIKPSDSDKCSNKKMTVLFRRGLRPANGEVDRKLWQWYSDTSLQQGTKVSKRVVQARAKWAFHQAGITDFKASDGWYRRWVKRCQNFSPDQLSKVCSIEPELPSSSTLSTRCETPSSKNVEGGSISTNESISQEKSVDMQQVAEEANRETESIEPCCSSSISDQTSESNAMLSTPMLNIVDYLPPEVMHSLHGSTLSSDSLESVFAGPSMDSLYYPEHNMLSDCDNFHLDLQHSDSYPCSIPTTTEADRLKDIVGLISSQSNTSSGLLRDNDNVVSTCSSDNEDFVNSIFKDVGFHMDVQVGINSEGSSVNVPEMTSTVSQDVLSPEVILESHADTRRNPEAVEPASKKSKKSVVQHRKKGERYLPQFKVKVLAYAASHTLRETAKKFKVNDGTISSWKKEKDWKRQLTQNRKKVQTPVSHPVDQQFLTWLRRCREQGREVTAGEVKDKARQIMGQSSTDNCHWYKLWVSRFDEEQVYREGLEREKSKQEHHIQYPQAFKMEVAVFAQLHSQIVAARTFNVSRKRVFEWLQLHRAKHTSNEAESSERSCERVEAVEEITSKKLGSRRSDTDKEIDQEIWEWYQTQQTRGSKPTWHEVQAKGLELYRCKGNENIKCSYRWYKRWCDRFHVILRHEGDDAMLEWALTQLELGNSLSHNDLQVHALTLASDTAFKASPGWAIRFCKRHPELLQQSPVLDTALPTPLLRKVETFRSEVQRTVRDGKLALSHVGNMDELYLNFSALVSGSTTNSKRQLLVRRSEMENCHATIVLACLADGNILPPAVITKLGGVEEEAQPADNSVVVLQQEEGLMDSACMCQWLQYVWFKHVPEPNLLLLDCHQPHTGDTVGAEFSSHQSTRLIIPGGCTSKLQPLEVSLKSMFHTSIQKQWSLFNSRSTGAWDGTANKLQLPGRKEIVDWVTVAYQHLQTAEQETVRRSFLVTGLTVATNKSEDHFIENLSMIPSNSVL